MKKCVFIILLCICASNSYGQENRQAFTKAQFLGSVNFKQFLGGVILIQARFDTIQTPFNFLLDTGSGGISIDSTTCLEFGIATFQTDTIISGIGGNKRVRYVFDKSLSINTLKTEHLNFHVNDYSVLSGIYGGKIDGIIGYSFFSRYILKINYDNKQIEFFSPGDLEYPKRGYTFTPVFTRLPAQSAEVADGSKLKMPFYFDTGAGLALLLSNAVVEDSALLHKKRKPVITSVDGFVGKATMRLTITKKLRMGPFTFREVPTYLYDDKDDVIGYPHIGGLLGSEIFRRFNMILNYPKKEIHLQPNMHFMDPFDYSYTGLNLYFFEEQILVDEIIAGSPAEKAGLLKGDEIISVGKDLSLNIDSYRTTLQVANEIIPINIRRKNDLLTIIMRTTSIQ